MAITNTRQDWSPGKIVKVGFLQLRVIGFEAIYDGLPDIYTLESIKGNRRYTFTPYNGLERVS